MQVVCSFNIEVKEILIQGELIKSDIGNSYYFTWENDSLYAFLDGANYSKKTLISDEGEHTIELANGVKVVTYKFSIDHYYVEDSREESTCTDKGYIKYFCNQCGDEVQDEIPLKEHSYIKSTEPSTCTEFGFTIYKCQYCDYTKEYLNDNYPKGHNYTNTIIIAPTCTTDGCVDVHAMFAEIPMKL